MHKYIVTSILFLVAAASCTKVPVSTFQNASSAESHLQERRQELSSLTPILNKYLEQLGGNAGLIIMNKEGRILYKKYLGVWNDNTYIPIASGSKWPSMATVMTLVDDGLLHLTDKVSQYYPEEYSSINKKDITLKELMSHTSGLAGLSIWISAKSITLQHATEGIGEGGYIGKRHFRAAQTPYAPHGTKFAYGGVSMHVAGGIAEKVSGKMWDILFKEKIADNCNMQHTNYIALGNTKNYRIAGGAGTTMMDYANFLLMLLNNGEFDGKQVLSAASVDAILSDQTNGVPLVSTPYEDDYLRKKYRYGLGCWIENYYNYEPSEFGDQGAFGFSPWIDKSRNIIGVFFVLKSLSAVNKEPTIALAPYTLIRNKVAEIIPVN